MSKFKVGDRIVNKSGSYATVAGTEGAGSYLFYRVVRDDGHTDPGRDHWIAIAGNWDIVPHPILDIPDQVAGPLPTWVDQGTSRDEITLQAIYVCAAAAVDAIELGVVPHRYQFSLLEGTVGAFDQILYERFGDSLDDRIKDRLNDMASKIAGSFH
jgi:hypothetical protein